MTIPLPTTMKALYFETTGAPLNVLRLGDVAIPCPGAGQVRVRVHACALNPADWAVCEGFLPVPPPRGIGFDVAGSVDALGEGVTSVSVGDLVFGVPDYMGQPTGGAAEYAVPSASFFLSRRDWTPRRRPRCRWQSRRQRAASIFCR